MGTPGSISFSLGGGGKSAARKPGSNGIGFSLGKSAQKAAPISAVFGVADASDDEEQQDQSNKRQRLDSSGCLKNPVLLDQMCLDALQSCLTCSLATCNKASAATALQLALSCQSRAEDVHAEPEEHPKD